MMPPSAAPPPVATAVRFPLPLALRSSGPVSTGRSEPFRVTESRRTCRTAPPANLPRGLASVTVPLAVAPWGLLRPCPPLHLGNGAAEGLAGLAELGADRGSQAYGHSCSGRDYQGLPCFGFLRLLGSFVFF